MTILTLTRCFLTVRMRRRRKTLKSKKMMSKISIMIQLSMRKPIMKMTTMTTS